jgi:hypothetical protein
MIAGVQSGPMRACRETRNLLNPAMLSTLNRRYELELYLRAARRLHEGRHPPRCCG